MNSLFAKSENPPEAAIASSSLAPSDSLYTPGLLTAPDTSTEIVY